MLKSAGYADLVRMLLAGLTRGPTTAEQRAALERLSLGDASGLADRAMRALVLGALRRG